MKTKSNIYYFLLSLLMVLGMASCNKKDYKPTGGSGVPTVTRVRLTSKTDTIKAVEHRITLDSSSVYNDRRVVPFDSTITEGRLNTQYAILGTNLLTTSKISINGVSVYFQPGLVTDNSIIFTIPDNVPFGPSQSNKISIVTQNGTVDYTFSIKQPPPVIESFNPVAAGEGEIVTIKGRVFNSVTTVKFDDVPAQIVGTPSTTEIQVKVPAGIVQSYIYVTTPGGTSKSPASFGFKSVVYDDMRAMGWSAYDGYNSTRDYANTEHPKRGANAIKVTYTNAYGALQMGYNGATVDVKKVGLTAMKFSVYGGAGTVTGQRVQVVINGQYGKAFLITIVPGQYTDFTIPLSALGSPTELNEIVLQSYGGGVPSVIYVDDMGFI